MHGTDKRGKTILKPISRTSNLLGQDFDWASLIDSNHSFQVAVDTGCVTDWCGSGALTSAWGGRKVPAGLDGYWTSKTCEWNKQKLQLGTDLNLSFGLSCIICWSVKLGRLRICLNTGIASSNTSPSTCICKPENKDFTNLNDQKHWNQIILKGPHIKSSGVKSVQVTMKTFLWEHSRYTHQF